MGATAEATLDGQDQEVPDSLAETGEEPEEVEVEPSPDEDATDLDELAAADDADSDEQPEDEGAAPDDRPRDEHGRFISAEAAPSAAGPSKPETSPPEPTGTPFSFRVDGNAVDVEGAVERDGVISIPRTAWDGQIQNRLANRGRIQHVQERMQSRVRQLESEAEAREERFRTVLGKVDELFSDPARVKAFYERYQHEAPRFKLEIENELLKSQSKRHEQSLKSRESEAEEREFAEMAPVALTNAVGMVVDQIAKDANVDRKAIADDLWGLWDSGVPLYFRVQEGDGSGLDPKEHTWGVNLALVERIAKPYVELQRKSTVADKAKEVEAKNSAALGKGAKPKAPPTAPANGSPTPGGEAKYPTTREEYEAFKKKKAEEYNLPW